MTPAPATTTPHDKGAPAPGAPGAQPARSRHARSPGAARRVAAVHQQGDSFRIVVAALAEGGSEATVVESRTIPLSEAAHLSAALAPLKVEAVVHVVGSTRTIVRCVPMPGGGNGNGHGAAPSTREREDLASGLALVAEAELPGTIPAHRRAAGVIRPGPGSAAEGSEAALVIGWPVREGDAIRTRSGVRDESWAAELAALAVLAEVLGGAELAIYADKAAGSVAVLACGRAGTGSNGTIGAGAWKTSARVLRADNSSDHAWRESVAAAAAEARAAVGLPPAPIAPTVEPAFLLLSPAGPRRVPGAPADPAWLRTYGIAYGAVCAAAQPDPAARSLLSLSAEAPDTRENILGRSLAWMAVPRNAAMTLCACVLALLFVPYGAAAARNWVLTSRAGGAVQLHERLGQAERRAAFYEQLKTRRWPMTKLLADVAAAAPVGVIIDSLNLSREQGVSISGKADKAELVPQFAKNLRDSAVFGSVATPTIDAASAGVQFSLEAQVPSPLFPGPRADDFGTKTLAVRLYGESAAGSSSSGDAPSASGVSDNSPREAPASAEPSRRTGPRPRTTRDDTAKGEEAAAATRKPAASNGIPAVLSDADIAKMDRLTAMKEFSSRKSAAAKADVDAATKQRLLDEAEKCRARMQEAAKEAAKPGGTGG